MHQARQQASGCSVNKWLFWQRDWFVGLLAALVFFLGANSDLMQSLERKAYDLGVLASSRTPSDKIAVIGASRHQTGQHHVRHRDGYT